MEVFFSYCHKDERYRNKIDTHLSTLKRQGLISNWSDHKITAGKGLDIEIANHLESAEIILLLISPDFIASDYCYSIELKKAIERHQAKTARVIPIIGRPCDWKGLPFSNLKAVPTDGKPITTWSPQDLAYNNVARSLREVIEELRSSSPPTDNTPPKHTTTATLDTETIELEPQLSIDQSNDILRNIGCPCLALKIICKSKRPAKIAGTTLHVRGPHILTAIQRAFSTNFGYSQGEAMPIEDPSFTASFLPTIKPDIPHGFVIEQDDIRRFLLPAEHPLLYFADAPPNDVLITVRFLDGTDKELMRGIEVQKYMPDLIRMRLDRKYNLNPNIPLKFGLNISSQQLPDSPTTQFLNDQPLIIPPHPQRDVSVDEQSDHIRLRAKILRAGAEKDYTQEEWMRHLVLNSLDREVRRDAIVSLRRLATPAVRDLFFNLLTTEHNENTRELIIRSFALVGVAEDIQVVERLSKSESSRFCKEAASIAFHYLRQRFVPTAADNLNPSD